MEKEALRRSMLLYAVTDRYWLGSGETLESRVRAALEGGATFVQLREKELTREQMREQAVPLKKLCGEFGVPLVINDDVELAAELDCDGAHVGGSDMEVGAARKLLGDGKILGASVQSVADALAAQAAGADYLGVGAVFPTGSKADAVEVPHAVVREITEAVNIPVVAIGGITLQNVRELSGTGIDGIAVISAIFGQPDSREAARALAEQVREKILKEDLCG